jgi:hypothetical protein
MTNEKFMFIILTLYIILKTYLFNVIGDDTLKTSICVLIIKIDSFSYLTLPKIAGSRPAEAVGFFWLEKNPQHAFLRRESKIICPMSQLWGM